MAITHNNLSPTTSLSSLKPIPPPSPQHWPADPTSVACPPDLLVEDGGYDGDKENSLRRKSCSVPSSDAILSNGKRRRITKQSGGEESTVQRPQMKAFPQDYTSLLQYDPRQEAEREGKTLRFHDFAQVKEIPSYRDYSWSELDNMYTGTHEIRENAARNTTEMWYDCDNSQHILEKAKEEDEFHMVRREEDEECELMHPATFQVYKEQEEEEMEDFCSQNMDWFNSAASDYYANAFQEEGSCLPKKEEDEHSTTFCCGGRTTEYVADFGMEVYDVDMDYR